jgi:hypothetical protein
LNAANVSDITPSPRAPLSVSRRTGGSEALNSRPLPFGGEGVPIRSGRVRGLLGHRMARLSVGLFAI